MKIIQHTSIIYNDETPENVRKNQKLFKTIHYWKRDIPQTIAHLNSNNLPKMTKIGRCTRD